MGMGYAACVGTSISYEDLVDLLPKEISAIEIHPDFEDWGTLADSMTGDISSELKGLVLNLYESFKKITDYMGTYLRLNLLHYDSEDGSRYDEVNDKDGCIFEVYNHQTLTEAGKKFQMKLESFSYVSFG